MHKMPANPMFWLTAIAYLAILAINLYKPKGTGDQLVGWGFIQMVVLAAYALCSMVLTVSIALNGKFEWIAESKALRTGIVCIGWLALMAGVFYMSMINSDWRVSGTANGLGLALVHYGALWIPLLMLVPYAILLSPEGYDTLNPNLYKIPLLAGCLIGLFFHFMGNEQLGNLLRDNKAVDSLKYQSAMEQIDFEDRTEELLYYMYDGTDPRLTQAALAKLKSKGNFESELLDMLNQCDENYDYLRVFAYLEHNTVAQPELFVKPLNKAMFRASEELKYRLQSFGSENDFLAMLNIDGLCVIVDTLFKNHKSDFLASMQKIQAELEPEPKPAFVEIRNKYKTTVNAWLDAYAAQQQTGR